MRIDNSGFAYIPPLTGDSKNVFDLDVQVRHSNSVTSKNGGTNTCTSTCPNGSCVSCGCQTDADGCNTNNNCYTHMHC